MPSLRSILRAYLGIDLVLQRDSGLAARLAHIERQQTDLLRKLGIANDSLARIVAKLDPSYAQDMFSPETRVKSDEIAKRVMKQLLGDAAARIPTDTQILNQIYPYKQDPHQ